MKLFKKGGKYLKRNIDRTNAMVDRKNIHRQERYDSIDGLRVVSCIGIIVMHIQANTNYQLSGFLFERLIPACTEFVYLFLMISGFGLCCGYYDKFKSGTINLESFYLKRYGKILPFFSVLILADVILSRSVESIYEGFLELTLVYGLLPNNELSVIGVGWTLGVIFLFYMLFPFFVFLLGNRKRAWISFAVALLIHGLCEIYFFTDKFVIESFSFRHSFLYCAPYFLAGGLIYLCRRYIIAVVKTYRGFFLLLCALATALWLIGPRELLGYDIETEKVLLVSILWLAYAISSNSILLNNKLFHYFSGISLEAYLCHMVVFRILEKLGVLYLLGDGAFSFFFVCLMTISCVVIFVQAYRWAAKNIARLWSQRSKK